MFENPRRGRQARNFTTNVPKILVLKSSSEQIFSRKLPLGAPYRLLAQWVVYWSNSVLSVDTHYSVFHKTQAKVEEASSKAGVWHHASFSFFSTKCHLPWQYWQNSKFLIKLFHSVTVLTLPQRVLIFDKGEPYFPLKSLVPTSIKG